MLLTRCQAMVWAPASNPCPASWWRSLMINATVAAGIAVGWLCGRLDRGSNAASPSARYRATKRLTQPGDTL